MGNPGLAESYGTLSTRQILTLAFALADFDESTARVVEPETIYIEADSHMGTGFAVADSMNGILRGANPDPARRWRAYSVSTTRELQWNARYSGAVIRANKRSDGHWAIKFFGPFGCQYHQLLERFLQEDKQLLMASRT